MQTFSHFVYTSALALCYSVAEYCSPVWSQSHHCKKLDVALNECLRLVSGCIKSTPTDLLPTLSGIQPADIRRDRNILNLRERALADTHIFHQAITSPLINNRLKSRMPLSTRMHHLAGQLQNNTSPDQWAMTTWSNRWHNLRYHLCDYIREPSEKPPGYDLKRNHWVLLNRIRSGYGRYASHMYRIGLSYNPYCVCGEIQTPQHVLLCHIIGIKGDISIVDDDFRNWINDNRLLIL